MAPTGQFCLLARLPRLNQVPFVLLRLNKLNPSTRYEMVQRKIEFSPFCHVISQIMWQDKMAVRITFRVLWHAFLLLFVLLNKETSGFKLNTRSKHYGAKLGEPAGEWQGELPPDQWFVQSLDHFNPSDTRTWKQVYLKSILKENTKTIANSLVEIIFDS